MAATFGAISGQVEARANTKNATKPVTQYAQPNGSGATGVAANDFVGASFDSASASAAPVIISNRRMNFELLATTATDTSATPSNPRSSASSTISQPFLVSEAQRIILSSNFSAASNAAEGSTSASAFVANASSTKLVEISSVQGTSSQRSAVIGPGNFTLTATAISQRFAPGSNAASIQMGAIVFTSPSDINGDLVVDASDLQAWAAVFGAAGPLSSTGDLDGSAVADGLDFLLWQRQFGNVPSAAIAAATSVPEPSACLLLAAASACMMLRSTSRSNHCS